MWRKKFTHYPEIIVTPPVKLGGSSLWETGPWMWEVMWEVRLYNYDGPCTVAEQMSGTANSEAEARQAAKEWADEALKKYPRIPDQEEG